MERDENIHKNLISLLKIFKNRPYHLSKYLLDNQAFNNDFLKKIKKSDKLSDLSDTNLPNYFHNINQMEDFYNSLLEESKEFPIKKTKKEIIEDLNLKLNKLIESEMYEEAAALRDFMLKNGIKKK
jgi:hypothetical protein